MAKPTQAEIDDEMNKASDLLDEGKNPWPGMTYIEGVRDTLMWIDGQNDGDAPLSDAG